MQESTNQFDPNGVEIFVGTNVSWNKGFFYTSDKKAFVIFGVYKIKKVVEDNCISYNLGDIANSWTGKDVLVVSDEEFEKHGLNYKDEFYIEDGVVKKLTNERWLGNIDFEDLFKKEQEANWHVDL